MPESPLSIEKFGRQLVLTRDLDPVYVILWQSNGIVKHKIKLWGWLIAYWSFYHMGTAGWITDGLDRSEEEYWRRHLEASSTKNYPRCSERRHYRGQKAINSSKWLAGVGLEGLWLSLLSEEFPTCREVMAKVQQWPMFGPWIAFKVADMLERLALVEVSFDIADAYLFDAPKEGAAILRKVTGAGVDDSSLNSWALDHVIKSLNQLNAPPRFERKVDVQEAETVLCKWKSSLTSNYHIGEDIESCHQGLLRVESRTGRMMLAAGKAQNFW